MKNWKRTLGILGVVQIIAMASFVYWYVYNVAIQMNVSAEEWQHALWFIMPIVVVIFLLLACIFRFAMKFSNGFAVLGGLVGAFALPAEIFYVLCKDGSIVIPVWLFWSLVVTMTLVSFMYIAEIWRVFKIFSAQEHNLR